MLKLRSWSVISTVALAGSLLAGCGDSETTATTSPTTTTGPTTSTGGGGTGGMQTGGGGTGADGGGGSAQGGGGTGGMADVCGDGMVGTSEGCDDGNTDIGDGCDGNCDVETGYLCTGRPSVCAPECGDGQIIAPEECDDSDADPGDGCSDTCTIEPGFVCPTEGADCVALDGSCTFPFDLALIDNAGVLEGNASGDTTGASDDVALASCDGGSVGDGGDLVYAFSIPDARDVTVDVTFSAADGIFRVLTAPCDPATGAPGEIGYGDACADQAGAAGAETLTLLGLPAGTYYIAVDGAAAGQEGAFSVVVSGVASTCGDGVVAGTEECDDMNAASGDGCANCTLEPQYACTGEPSMCTTTCQDGVVDRSVLEQCDDGNNVNGDRCSDTCQLERDVTDTEPNDSVADAQIVLDGEIVFGTITPNDFDIYELTLATDSWVTLEIYTTIDGDDMNYNGNGQLGPVGDCPQFGGTDPDLFVFDQAGDVTNSGTAIISDDLDGVLNCPFIGANVNPTTAFLAAGTYYIRVDGYSASGVVPQYALDIRTDDPIAAAGTCDTAYDLCDPTALTFCDGTTNMCELSCGDGILDAGEECDDGNGTDDDRCSNGCLLNFDVLDMAGNDTFGTAQSITSGQIAKGSTTPGTDVFDLYTFTLATDAWVAVEEYTTVDGSNTNYDGYGLDNTLDCVSTDADVRLFNAAGDPTTNTTALVFDDFEGDGICGYIGPNRDVGSFLTAGTYYIKVSEFGDNQAIPRYLLDFQVLAPLQNGAACLTTYDLCNPAAGLVCSATTNTCAVPPPPIVDRSNWEIYTAGDFDLQNTTLTFMPSGGTYGTLAEPAASYPDVPGTGTVSTGTRSLSDDGNSLVPFVAFTFPFFGVNRTQVYVNANGNLTFTASDDDYTESGIDHFDTARISFFFDDLRPNLGGTVTVDEFADRFVVTFNNVPILGGVLVVQAQVALYDDGTITITHLATTVTGGLVGVSAGDNANNRPAELDFSAQVPVAPIAGDFVINEWMANPSTLADTNCDGAFSTTQDEFVELVNVSGVPLDLTGMTLSDAVQVRHTFGAAILPAGLSVVVYGGGVSMCPDVNGVVASTGVLGLNNPGDTITLSNGDTVTFGAAAVGISATLSPDLVGVLTDHDLAGGSTGDFSPGFRATGRAF